MVDFVVNCGLRRWCRSEIVAREGTVKISDGSEIVRPGQVMFVMPQGCSEWHGYGSAVRIVYV